MQVTPTTAVAPFTVLVDTAETQPFQFDGICADAADDYAPLIIPTRFTCLGRYPNSTGDYSVCGYASRVGVERKSVDDALGTVLGFADGRRERFEQELRNLAASEAGAVVVEGSLGDCIRLAPEYGKRTAEENGRAVFRSIVAFQQDYKTPIVFCDNRELAQFFTFRFLERFWKNEQRRERQLRRQQKGVA